MIGRLRVLVERPLDPRTARLVVILAGAVCLGFAALVGLGMTGPGATGSPVPVARPPHASVPALPASPRRPSAPDRPSRSAADRPAQDPQDRPGSPAARRADRELAAHRALQHVPWQRGGVSIGLVGARGERAVLAVVGDTLAADHRAWRSFLRRFHDDGRSYLPRLVVDRVGAPRAGWSPMNTRIRAHLAARRRIPGGALARVLGGVLGGFDLSPGFPHPDASCGAQDLPRSPRHTKVDH